MGSPVKVEKVNGADALMLRGRKNDVEKIEGAIGEIEAAAQQ
jgi:hypothetical protein